MPGWHRRAPRCTCGRRSWEDAARAGAVPEPLVARALVRERTGAHHVAHCRGESGRWRIECDSLRGTYWRCVRATVRVVGIGLTVAAVAEFFRVVQSRAGLARRPAARFLERPVEVRESNSRSRRISSTRRTIGLGRGALWRVLQGVRNVFEQFRGEFIGKASPGTSSGGAGSGRDALSEGPRRGIQEERRTAPDYVMVEAYSHEVSSARLLAGDEVVSEAVFFSYAYPEPPGSRPPTRTRGGAVRRSRCTSSSCRTRRRGCCRIRRLPW